MRKVLGDSLHTFSSVRKYERPIVRTEWLLSTLLMRRFFDFGCAFAQNDALLMARKRINPLPTAECRECIYAFRLLQSHPRTNQKEGRTHG